MAVENVQAQGITRAYLASADIARTSGAAGGAPRRPGRTGDELALSDEARSLAAARQAVASAPEVREERIAAIRQRIQDGTYVVSSELLARGMLRYAEQQG
jgi:negative regulator of flagellin synthesis FlgM